MFCVIQGVCKGEKSQRAHEESSANDERDSGVELSQRQVVARRRVAPPGGAYVSHPYTTYTCVRARVRAAACAHARVHSSVRRTPKDKLPVGICVALYYSCCIETI